MREKQKMHCVVVAKVLSNVCVCLTRAMREFWGCGDSVLCSFPKARLKGRLSCMSCVSINDSTLPSVCYRVICMVRVGVRVGLGLV